MSLWTPPKLLDLAAMSLLREDLAMSALEFLPIRLFPPLFMEAFYGSHSKTLKTMVHAWPFVRLPLGPDGAASSDNLTSSTGWT